jgi:hypothetical protein
MKNITLLTLMLFTIVFAKAQITLETNQYSSPGGDLKFIHLERAGFKYAIANSGISNPTQFNLYNLDHTLYRSINIGPVPTGAFQWNVQYVTETLWDNDSTDIDYAIVGAMNGNGNYYFTRIYNENGSLIFANDTCTFWYTMGGNFGNPLTVPIFNTDSGTKMILLRWTSNFDKTSLVYCLPGKLECMQCYDNIESCGGIPEGVPNVLMGRNLLDPYPNPAENTSTIPYVLPEGENTGEIIFYNAEGKEVKRFRVDRTFNKITISSAELAAGTYYYQLRTEKNILGAKKLIIVR